MYNVAAFVLILAPMVSGLANLEYLDVCTCGPAVGRIPT